jgi:hypothetical protein
MSVEAPVSALYMEDGDPALAKYYPAWVGKLAPDVILEGSMIDGPVQGAEAVRTIVLGIKSLYERQQFKYAGPCPDMGFMEDYVATVRGQPLGCIVLVSTNAAGQTQRVVASYRPRSTLMLFSRLLREKFAGLPFADQFAPLEP